MRVLITGATGFVGRHLVAHANAQGADVVALSRGQGVDLLDRDATAAAVRDAAADVVFHLAAEASVPASWDDPAGTMSRNLAMTTSLLEAVAALNTDPCVLVAVSGEIYGAPIRLPMDEDHPLAPQNPYAVSKAAVDLAAAWYAESGRVQTVRPRSFNTFGPGQSDLYVVGALVARIAAAMRASSGDEALELVMGNTSAKRDFTDVRDAVRAYWQLAERAESGPFNVCSGISVSVQTIIETLSAQLGREIVTTTDPALLRPVDVPEIYGSRERLTKLTGWEPAIALDQSLNDALAATGVAVA